MAQYDRLERIAVALERIAKALEASRGAQAAVADSSLYPCPWRVGPGFGEFQPVRRP